MKGVKLVWKACCDCGEQAERNHNAQRCTPCAKAKAAKWRAENRDVCARSTKAWKAANVARERQTQKNWRGANPVKVMLRNARFRARATGREFSITADDIPMPELCPVFGTRLEQGVGAISPNSPSVDRIDNSKGYVPGNVVVVSMKANNLKSRASLAELKALVAFYERAEREGP